ncbi:hypothetical protein HK100_006883 [Physocladia obscura]|uniref:BZIP domain-containing protein n=1 Tax=Physocladia obscura TaxID=109957 RepID=A0AAD5XCE9_9FUNG|nr:hypothetical protein HK100_006883 [Physocladia obscura]
MDGNSQNKHQHGNERQHEQEDVEHLFDSLLNGGDTAGDFDAMFASSFGVPMTMQMSMPGLDLHGIDFDMGGLSGFNSQPVGITKPTSSSSSSTAVAGTSANYHSTVPLPLLPTMSVMPVMPAPSARVQQALASDIASEALVLLEGPAKKKPGRKKKGSEQTQNTTATPASHAELHHSIKTEHIAASPSASISSVSDTTVVSKKRKLTSAPPTLSAPVSPASPIADSTRKSIEIAPQPLENSAFLPTSVRKLSISATEYLTLPASMSPNSNFLTPSPQPVQVTPPPVLTKHQERMMKNRASADESRKKHKDHVEKLEKICRELVIENEALKKRVLEVEKWAEQAVQQQQAAATAAMASFTQPALGSAVSAGSVSPASVGCDSISIDGFLSDAPFGSLPSPTIPPATNAANLFEMFFGGGDYFPTNNSASSVSLPNQTKAGVKGTILLAFLFSFSMLVFPTSLFQQSSPHFYTSTPSPSSHHSSAAAVPTPVSAYFPKLFNSPVSNGISSYIPRVLAPLANRQNPSLNGNPALSLIDSGSASTRGDTLVVYTPLLQTSSNKLLGLPGRTAFLTIGPTNSYPHSPAATRPTHTTPESPRVVLTNAGNTPVTIGIEALLALISVDAGGNGDLRISKARLEALRGLLISDSSSITTATTGVTVIPAPTTLASADKSSKMKQRTDLIAQGRPLVFDSEVERDNDSFYYGAQASIVVEEVDAVVVPGIPPIKEDGDRASVKRRNIARNRADGRISESSSDGISTFSDAMVPRLSESGSTVKGGLYEEGAYCPIVNGPVLSLVADLGGISEEETTTGKIDEEENEQSGYRLMLDVQVVGAKLVRY